MAQEEKKAPDWEQLARPLPPERMFADDSLYGLYLPAHDLVEWIRATFLRGDSKLYNEEHAHLVDAHIAALWTNDAQMTKGKAVAGTAEIPMFRCAAWQRGRQEQQMREWFGSVPQFLITLDARYAIQASDAEFCALVEHELYHCGQEQDGFGAPKFTKDGFPKYTIRGHDVEEFVGVVRRYGAGNAAGETAKLVEAANKAPEVANVDIRHACGTCHLKVA
jgi:hypothetical protein